MSDFAAKIFAPLASQEKLLAPGHQRKGLPLPPLAEAAFWALFVKALFVLV